MLDIYFVQEHQTESPYDCGVPQFITPLNVRDMETLGIVTEVE